MFSLLKPMYVQDLLPKILAQRATQSWISSAPCSCLARLSPFFGSVLHEHVEWSVLWPFCVGAKHANYCYCYHCNSWEFWLDLPCCSVSICSNVFQCQMYVLKCLLRCFLTFAWKIDFTFMESCWRNAKLVATVCKDPLKEIAEQRKSRSNWRDELGWAGDVWQSKWSWVKFLFQYLNLLSFPLVYDKMLPTGFCLAKWKHLQISDFFVS